MRIRVPNIKYLLLIILYFPICVNGQGFIAVDTLINIPSEITKKLKGQINSVVTIDFTGDGTDDYLVTMDSEDEHDYEFFEYWITSEFELFKKKKKFNEGIYHYHFINLDKDSQPEIFSAVGFEDGIDYGFFDLDMKTSEEELIFYFNPVILESEIYYWGYPWDIQNLITKNIDGEVLKKASINHNIIRDGNITLPEDQPHFPVIFFSGHSTQSFKVTEIITTTWMTIEELKMEAHNNR